MKKFFLYLLIIISFCTTRVHAFEIIYPKSNDVTINSPVTFFAGNEKPDANLTINDNPVKIHPSGAFYQPVKLIPGENKFVISNNGKSKIYKITRNNTQTGKDLSNELIYDSPKMYKTTESTILRATPFDRGLNRLQHYDDTLYFTVIGEINGFYKVKLARDDYAYIKKDQLTECTDILSAEIIDYEYEENEREIIFSIKLSEKVPYEVSELRTYRPFNDKYETFINKLGITIYNIKNLPENKFEYQINLDPNAFGYKSYYKPDNTLVIMAKKPPKIDSEKPLAGLTITVDAGHGGSEYGAIGCLGDKEKNINLDIAQRLKLLLKDAGANVVMTRDDDREVLLYKRVEIANNTNSDVFISIHNNSLPDSLAESNRLGTSVYFFYEQANVLAKTLHNALLSELKTNNDGVRADSFAVIRNTQALSVLVEIAYMINPDDNAKLETSEFRQKAAEALLHGLENYFRNVQQ